MQRQSLIVGCGIAIALSGTLRVQADDPSATYSITDLAPKSAYFLVGADHCDEAVAAWQRTGYYELWKTPEMQAFIAGPKEELWKSLTEMVGMTPEELANEEALIPSGSVGLALYPTPAGGSEDSVPQAGSDQPHFFFVAEFDAGQTEALQTRLDAMLQKVRDAGKFEMSESEVEGRVVHTLAEMEDDPADIEARKQMMIDSYKEAYPDEEVPDWVTDMDFSSGPKYHASFTLSGSRFLYATDRAVLEDSFLTLDGLARESVAANEALEPALALAGGRGDVYMAALIEPMLQMMSEEEEGGIEAIFPGATGILEVLGLTDVKALAASIDVAPADAAVIMHGAVFVPSGPRGLFNLMVNRDEPVSMPEWVDPNVITCGRFNIDFNAIVPLIRASIDALPEEERGMASQQFETSAAPVVTAIFEQLGPEVRVVSWPRQADPADSFAYQNEMPIAISIACKDDQIVQNALAPFIGMAGIAPRDFLGYRIYDFPGEVIALSLGFGKGQMVLGNSTRIEGIFRAQADSPRLSEDAGFKRAAASIPTTNFGFGYQNFKEYWRQWRQTSRIQIEMARQQMEGMEDEEVEGTPFIGFFNSIDADKIPDEAFMAQYVGDSTYDLVRTDTGLVFHSRSLLPAKE